MKQTQPTLPFEKLAKQRQSVRQYQTNQTIPAEDLNEILELAHSAPSAWNLQHWRVIVVQDPAHKQALLPIANQQQQVVDASAVFIILGDLEANKTAEAVFRPLVDDGLMPEKAYESLLGNINQAYETQSSLGLTSKRKKFNDVFVQIS